VTYVFKLIIVATYPILLLVYYAVHYSFFRTCYGIVVAILGVDYVCLIICDVYEDELNGYFILWHSKANVSCALYLLKNNGFHRMPIISTNLPVSAFCKVTVLTVRTVFCMAMVTFMSKHLRKILTIITSVNICQAM